MNVNGGLLSKWPKDALEQLFRDEEITIELSLNLHVRLKC